MIKYMGTALFAILILLPITLIAGERYERIYVFGGSLVDSGNLATLTGPLSDPPYFQNRLSNGPNMLDVLAGKMGLRLDASRHLIGPAVGNNYAVGGASAETHGSIDLTSQVALFLANHGGVAPDRSLYVMFIGSNDVRHARDAEDAAQAEQIVTDAAGVISTQIQVLAMAGARDWLVVNVPDMGLIPETGLLAANTGDAALPGRVTALTRRFNQTLGTELAQLRVEMDIDIQEFDLFSAFSEILDASLALGFNNHGEACFSSLGSRFNPGCDFGRGVGGYVFFDEIHPTARVHRMLGARLFAVLAGDTENKSSGG